MLTEALRSLPPKHRPTFRSNQGRSTGQVVSEGTDNRRRDLEVKPQEYAAAGIAEYWIVDPLQAEISVLVLEGQVYRHQGVFKRGQSAPSIFFAGFSVAVCDVLDAGKVV